MSTYSIINYLYKIVKRLNQIMIIYFEDKKLTNDKNDYSIIITTAAGKDAAKKIANLLVEKRLAACVQMFPIESVYSWQEKICEDDEVTLFIKSKTALFDEISAAIKANHEYEVPEIIQIPIINGLPDYLRWIDGCTNSR